MIQELRAAAEADIQKIGALIAAGVGFGSPERHRLVNKLLPELTCCGVKRLLLPTQPEAGDTTQPTG